MNDDAREATLLRDARLGDRTAFDGIAQRADADLVHEVAARTSQEVASSLGAVKPATRVLLDAPRRLSRLTTSGPARVH